MSKLDTQDPQLYRNASGIAHERVCTLHFLSSRDIRILNTFWRRLQFGLSLQGQGPVHTCHMSSFTCSRVQFALADPCNLKPRTHATTYLMTCQIKQILSSKTKRVDCKMYVLHDENLVE